MKNSAFEKYTDKETFDKIKLYPSVSAMWAECSKEFGDREAIVDGESFTYADLERDTAALRGYLSANGVKKGSRVAVFAPTSYNSVKAFLAVTTLGGVAVMLPAHLEEMAVFGCCMKFGASAILYDASLEAKLTVAKAKGIATYDIASSVAAPVECNADVNGDDPACIIFTGGTSGKNKGALLSNLAIMAGTRNGCYGYRDVFFNKYMIVLPLTHVFGLIRNMLTPLCTGSSVYVCRNPKNMFKEMAVYSPTVLVLVPALAELAINLSKQIGPQILGRNLKYIICGASAVPPHLIREYKVIGVEMFPGYGLTESANLVSGNPDNTEKPASVGIPYPDQELKVVDGELYIKGINVMTEYVGDPEETKASFEDGWFKTGDLVRFDEDGYLYIVGRQNDVIVLSTGENISPAEYETKFCELDYLADAMIYEDFNEGGSQILTLEVVPRSTCTVPADKIEADLREINGNLPSFARVSRIIVRKEDFARTPAMKKIRIKKNK